MHHFLHSYKRCSRLILKYWDISFVIMPTEINALCGYYQTRNLNSQYHLEKRSRVTSLWQQLLIPTGSNYTSWNTRQWLFWRFVDVLGKKWTSMFHKHFCFPNSLLACPLTSVNKTNTHLRHPMHCPSTGPGRSLLVHLSQSHLSPRTSYQLAAATKTHDDRDRAKVRERQG